MTGLRKQMQKRRKNYIGTSEKYNNYVQNGLQKSCKSPSFLLFKFSEECTFFLRTEEFFQHFFCRGGLFHFAGRGKIVTRLINRRPKIDRDRFSNSGSVFDRIDHTFNQSERFALSAELTAVDF